MATDDREKTAIITPFGLYEYNVMPFGLANAAQTFQRFMDSVLRGLSFVFCYLDDILIASVSKEQHHQHLSAVLERLQQHGLTINMSKCAIGKSEVKYLGSLVNAHGTSPLSERIEAITNVSKPATVIDLRRFLGTINFYRRFVPNAAAAQAPLHTLTAGSKKNDKRPIAWTPETELAFEKCKEQLAQATLLAHPAEGAILRIVTDASDYAMGAVLEQIVENDCQPLAFYSKKFSSSQSKYSTYDRELLAVYSAIKFFRHMRKRSHRRYRSQTINIFVQATTHECLTPTTTVS